MPRKRSHTRRSPRSNPRGRLDMRRGGYGFVQTAEGEYFIPRKQMRGAFPGDVVEVAPTHEERRGHASGKGERKRTARVVRVIERAHDELVGYFHHAEPFGVVEPVDPLISHDIFTQLSEHPEIPDGAIVRVAISTWPDRNTAATGTVVEVLGSENDERVAIDLIVAHHKLETAFSEAALAQAAQAVVDAEGALAEGYRDLRDRIIFTIDPVDAKDFDDAVSIQPVVLTNDGYVDAADGRGTPPWPSNPRLRTEEPVYDLSACGGERRCSSTAARRQGADAPGRGLPACASDETPPLPAAGSKSHTSNAPYWRVGVHIADVSHYVPWGSSVDLDARRRATSTYLVDRVIPMLPEALSNDVCSLRPGEDRRAMTVDMIVNARGEAVSVEAYPALIRSCARLTYDEAQRLLEDDEADDGFGPSAFGDRGRCSPTAARRQGDDASGKELPACARGETPPPAAEGFIASAGDLSAELGFRIRALSRIAKQRAALRSAAGGLDFDTVEAKARLDAEGHPIAVDLREKTDATQLIEEAMIMANEAVARMLRDAEFPCLYRVHEAPAHDTLEGLVPVLQEFSWFSGIDAAAFVAGNPHAIGKALDACKGRPEGALVTTLVLRSMKRAVYSPTLAGHYGLASAAYAHFTSPIRRYPDLVVHRMLRARLTRRHEKFDQEASSLPWLAEHSSEMERVAERAARESQESKIVELMEEHIGETFSALVTGVATFGLFVRLDNTAEGVIETDDLGHEYFVLDPVRHTLTGSDTGKQFRLGRRLAVRLVEADRRTRQLRFRLAK